MGGRPGRTRYRIRLFSTCVHLAVWRRVRLADELSIADLHRVIQILMGWDDDHLHRFRIQGRDYGIAYIGGPNFGEDAAAVSLSRFGFRPTERFLYGPPAWSALTEGSRPRLASSQLVAEVAFPVDEACRRAAHAACRPPFGRKRNSVRTDPVRGHRDGTFDRSPCAGLCHTLCVRPLPHVMRASVKSFNALHERR